MIGWFLTSRDFVVFLLSYILGLSNDKGSNESPSLCFRQRKLRRWPFLLSRMRRFVILFSYFDTNWKQSVANFQKFCTRFSISQWPNAIWGQLISEFWPQKSNGQLRILSLWNIAINSTQPKSGYSNEFSFLHLRDLIT